MAHVVPHAPQFWGSTLTSAHDVAHWVVPGEHVSVQTPAAHSWAPAHWVPHPPQLAVSVIGSTQTPEHICSPSAQVAPCWPGSLEQAAIASAIVVASATTACVKDELMNCSG